MLPSATADFDHRQKPTSSRVLQSAGGNSGEPSYYRPPRVGIKASELEDRVLTGLKDILLGNEDLIEVFVAEFKAEIIRLRKHRVNRERQTQRDMNKVNASIKRCLTFITEGDGDPGYYRRRW